MTQRLTLEPYQLEAHKAGRLKAIVVPMEDPPTKDTDHFNPLGRDNWCVAKTKHDTYLTSRHWRRAPFTPGDVVEVQYPPASDEPNDLDGPLDFITTSLTVATCEPIEVAKITEEQAMDCGIGPESPRDIYNPYPPELDLHSGPAFIRYWHTRHPNAKWGWYYPVEGATP